MLQVKPFEEYARDYEAWFDEYPFVFNSELTALKRQLLKVGENVRGIQVGLGTGRYAAPLGIREGIEPAEAMQAIASRRDLEIMDGVAERLPYSDLLFDFVLFATIEHLDDLPEALREAHRVLKPGGSIILGFFDKNGLIAQTYEKKRQRSRFYQHAVFYPVERVQKLLEQTGFRNLDFIQTLFGPLDHIREQQYPEEGYGKGGYVVVKGDKK